MNLLTTYLPTVAFLAIAGHASAVTLLFSVSGTLSASLDGADITDQPYTLEVTYDTDDVTPFSTPDPSTGFSVIGDTATINIGGNLVTITDPISVNINSTNSALTVGNDRIFQDMIIVFGQPSFATFDLRSPLAPLNVTDGFVQGTFAWQTEQGDFLIDDDSSAALDLQIAPVPEPSAAVFAALGLVGLMATRRSRS